MHASAFNFTENTQSVEISLSLSLSLSLVAMDLYVNAQIYVR